VMQVLPYRKDDPEHDVQFDIVPEQVRQVVEHSQIPVLLTVPEGHVLTHLVLVFDYLAYPGLQSVQSVADTPQVVKQPASQLLH
jgi:hypothetical protein